MSKKTKRNPDHVKRHNTPTINNEVISQQLEALLTPAIAAQQKYYKQLGLRDRIINLSLMVAAVLIPFHFNFDTSRQQAGRGQGSGGKN
jgi:hypothetical protein